MQGDDRRLRGDEHAAGPDAQPASTCRASRTRPASTSGVNGDHIAALEYDPKKIKSVLGLPRYGQFYKGKPITTMTYDFWVGRRGRAHDGTRFNIQEIFLSNLTNFLYDDGRAPAGDPSWWGIQKKQAVGQWANRIELLAMVEDTHDGVFECFPPQGGAIRPNAGPVAIGTFSYRLSDQSIAIRERANQAMQQIGERARPRASS